MTWASRVDDRMDEFALAWRDGGADPREYLSGLDDDERREMEMRIELFLDRAAPDQWDPDLYRGSLAEQVVETTLGNPAEAGRESLITMRVECGLGKREVAASLADDLGATSENDRRKISDYYHRLEWGTLSPADVSRRVIESIASILGTDRENISGAIPETGASSHQVFARYSAESRPGEPRDLAYWEETGPSSPPDWVDELFLGADEVRD